MMLLKDVCLYLNVDEFPREMRSEFLFRSCYINNFLTRRLRGLRLAREYKGILVQGRLSIAAPRISVEKNLITTVVFSPAHYAALRPGEEHEFFIGMITEGLQRCAKDYDIPLVELTQALEEFRRGGYRNEWTHRRKLLRQVGLRASLLCSLDQERFRLILKLERKDATVLEKQILETKPDEIIFTHRFKEVLLDGDSVVVQDQFRKPLFSIPVSALS